MLSVYINYPMGKISMHCDPDCAQIQKRNKPGQRMIFISKETVGLELNKLDRGDLKFSSVAGLNDVWIQINTGALSEDENLARTIQEKLGKFYKPLARAEIKTHCQYPLGPRKNMGNHAGPPSKTSQGTVKVRKEAIQNREKKMEEIVSTIISRITEFNFLYRGGPSLYFYRRIIELRKKHPKIEDFVLDDYCLEILYATLVSWDMNSRGAKLKYFDDFKESIKSCLPELEAIEKTLLGFSPAMGNEIIGFLRTAFLHMELMESSSRLVSNSKCLHFLFPSLCMPMDGRNTLGYLFGNTNESVDRYLDIIRLSFDVMRQPVQFDKYLDDNWNQSAPKLIDNAIILLRGISIKKDRGRDRKILNQEI
jgi:hypothetical protein